MRSFVLVSLLALSFSLQSGDKGWTEKVAEAKSDAAKQGKDILIFFFSSDEHELSAKLREEIFLQKAFVTEAPKNFVLLGIDASQKRALPDEIRNQHETLSNEFGIVGYPTVFLTDATGQPYSRVRFKTGGPEQYLELIQKLRARKAERDHALAAAEKASGIQKVKLMAAALDKLIELEVADAYPSLPKQITEADPMNESGATGRAYGKLRVSAAKSLAKERQFDEALQLMSAYIEKNKPAKEELFEAYVTCARLCIGKRDHEGFVQFFQRAIPFCPRKEEAESMTEIVASTKEILAEHRVVE